MKFGDTGRGIPDEIFTKIFNPLSIKRDTGNRIGLGFSSVLNYSKTWKLH